MSKPILCLDFDGVIHSYMSGWKGAAVILDPPVPGALQFIAAALEHFRVAIYSSRSGQPGGITAMREYLGRWSVDPVFGMPPDFDHGAWGAIEWPTEKPAAFVSIDDRALTFDGSWPSLADLRRFQPWNKGVRSEQFPVSVDRENGRITICGVVYDFSLFDWLGAGAVGSAWRIVARADGVVTIEAAD